MKKATIIIVMMVVTSASCFASVAGLTSPLDIGFGVRAQTLGGAFVAGINDSGSVYFNPAGLATEERVELQASYVSLLQDTAYQYVAAGLPTVDYGAFGVSFARLGTNNITLRDASSAITGISSQNLIEVITGWGTNVLDKNLYAGINMKLDYQDLIGASDTGFAMDMGILYRLDLSGNNINAGLIIKNLIEPQIKLQSDFDNIMRYCALGLSYMRNFTDDGAYGIGIYADFTPPVAVDYEFDGGIELKIFKYFFLRAGYSTFNISSFGAGFDLLDTVSIDYGMFMTEVDTENRVSLKVKFGESVPKMQANKQAIEEKKIADKARELVAKEMEKAQKELEKLKAELLTQKNDAVKQEYFKSFHYTKGLEGYYANDYKLSYAEFDTVYKADPNYLNVKYYYSLLKSIMEKQGAEVYSEKILEIYRKGVDLYMKEDYKGAKAEWEKILAIDQYNKLALENIKEVNDLIMRLENKAENQK